MIKFFAGHPTAANLMMIAIIALDLTAIPKMQRATFPDIAADQVEVRAIYPGASALEVENAVCQRIEEALDGVENTDEIRCEGREGVAVAVAKMIEGADLTQFTDDVKQEVEAITNFPEDVETPTVRQLGRIDFVALVAITGPMAETDLKAYAEAVKDRLVASREVTLVNVLGFSDHQIRIELRADRLRQLGLGVSDVAEVIKNHSLSNRVVLGSIRLRREP